MSDRPRPAPPQGPRGDRRDNDRSRSQVSYRLSYGRDSRESIPPRSNAVNRGPSDRDSFNSRQDRGRNDSRGRQRDMRDQRDQSGPQVQGPKSRRGNRGDRSNNNDRNVVNSSSNSVAIGSKRMMPPSEPKGYRNGRDTRVSDQPNAVKRGSEVLSNHRESTPPFKKPKNDRSNREENNRSRSQRGKGRRGDSGGQLGSDAQSQRGKRPDRSVAPPKLTDLQIYSVKRNSPLEVYKRVQQVGEGTYGKVYKAQNTITKDFVALKKLRLETEREGFPITAIREIKLLQSFDHPNVINLLEMMVEKNQIFMVFDYLDHDLTGLLTHPDLKMEEMHRKFIFKQLVEGLNYLHKKQIIHRDIKGSNILLDSIGRLKIADFGLARTMKNVREGESPDYTNRVITIWYRPPELLLGATDYGREVDIWGVGCLLVELYSKTAVFQGFDELGQLCKIFNVMGTPSITDWPDIENLPWFEMLKPKVNTRGTFAESFEPIMLELGFDLAKKLLALNPKNRLSTSEALKHPYFSEEPKPEPLMFLKSIEGEWHEFETKQQRRQERKRLQDVALAQQQKTPSMRDADDSANDRPGLGKYPGTGDVPMTQRSEGPEPDRSSRQASYEPTDDQSARDGALMPVDAPSSREEFENGQRLGVSLEPGQHTHDELAERLDKNQPSKTVPDCAEIDRAGTPDTDAFGRKQSQVEISIGSGNGQFCDHDKDDREVDKIGGESEVLENSSSSILDAEINSTSDAVETFIIKEAPTLKDASQDFKAIHAPEVITTMPKSDALDAILDEATA